MQPPWSATTCGRLRRGALLAIVSLAACRPETSPTPEASAGTSALLRDVEAWAQAALHERQVPGLSLVILRGDDAVLARGYGSIDQDRRTPVSADTVFQLGSIGKQFLAALVLRLAEEGRVSLDEPVTRYLPGLTRLPGGLRVRHLLSHTSGLRELFTIPAYQAGIEDLSRGREQLEVIVRDAPVDFEPGTRWSYSNTNYTTLALLVERITGRPYEQALDESFFRPLGLGSLRQCTPLPRDPGEARGHVLQGGHVTPSAPENMAFIRGDGGLCGSAADLARWMRLLATGRVVKPESYRAMSTRARLADGREADYGMGLSLVPLDGRAKVAHNGAMLGFSASVAYYPDGALTIAVLTNRGDVRTETIERRIARRLLGLAAPAFAEQPLPGDLKRRVLGSFDIGVFPIAVAEREGRLWLEVPPPGPTTPLRYVGGRAFVSDTEPDAYRVDFAEGDPAPEVRLFMGAMHWYGTRRPPSSAARN